METRLLWLSVLSRDVGRLKTSVSSSLTELFSSLREAFPPSWEQTLLGLVREEKFAFNAELILSLIFIQPVWAPQLLIVLEIFVFQTTS